MENKVTNQAYLLAGLDAPILSRCWLFVVLVNSFFLAADEGLAPPRVGNCTVVCG